MYGLPPTLCLSSNLSGEGSNRSSLLHPPSALRGEMVLVGNAFPPRADAESCPYDQEALGGSHQLKAISD